MHEREYTSKRYSILEAITRELKKVSKANGHRSDVFENVHPKMLFWDEIKVYPAVHMSAGTEIRDYQGGGFKDRFLNVTIRMYVKSEESAKVLELLLEDIETVIEKNGRLAYQDASGATHYTHDILITSIDTDEGALDPIAAGEMLLQVRY